MRAIDLANRLTPSEMAAYTLITENPDKPLPAKAFAKEIPSPNIYRKCLTIRQVRNITNTLIGYALVAKQKRKAFDGHDLSNTFHPQPGEGIPLKLVDRLYKKYGYITLNGLRGEMKDGDRFYLWHLAEKAATRTGMEVGRIFRALIRLAKVYAMDFKNLFDIAQRILDGHIADRDACHRKVKNRGAYFLSMLDSELDWSTA